MRIANIDDVISIPLEYLKVPYHYHQDRTHLYHWFCSMSMIIKVSTHLSSLMTVTTLTTMITAKNDHSKQRHSFCKLDHSAHQDDHHYTHDRRFCCYITIVAGGDVTMLSGRLHQRHHLFLWGSSWVLLPPSSYTRGGEGTLSTDPPHAFCFKSCSWLGHTISICK